MKTLIVGDVHGYFGYLNILINQKQPDLVICCGDFGYWPNVPSIKFKPKPQGSKILWIDGNHEDHWSLRDRKTDELRKDVIYMPRGSTYTLDDGRKILFMGGADSIDKNVRRLGYDWFPEEVISQKDLENLPNEKIDIVISHTCPLELVGEMLGYRDKDIEPSNHALSYIYNRYNPKRWYFGHWHCHKDIYLRDTKFTTLACLPPWNGFGRWWVWLE